MYYKITKTEFNNSPTFYSFAYPIGDFFYVQPYDDAKIQEGWEEITKEVFESHKPIISSPKTEEQTKIEQLEMDNALILMELAEKDARIEQAEADHATLLMELAMKGVI